MHYILKRKGNHSKRVQIYFKNTSTIYNANMGRLVATCRNLEDVPYLTTQALINVRLHKMKSHKYGTIPDP